MKWYALLVGGAIGSCSGLGLDDAGVPLYASANIGFAVAYAWYSWLRSCVD